MDLSGLGRFSEPALMIMVSLADGPKQKGVNVYTLAANRQRPLAGAMHNAVFKSWRRFRGQVLYVVPPLIAMYYTIAWANKR